MTGTPDERDVLQRVLMDRARAQAERDKVKPPKRLAPGVIAAALAVLVVLVVMSGFDAFLTTVQKVLEIQATEPVPDPSEPIPAFAVVEEPPAATEK
jgi:hypothetical protein